MMKKRWYFFFSIILFACIIASCHFPLFPQEVLPTTIDLVEVKPEGGAHSYSLTVNYRFEFVEEIANAEIYCTYTTTGGTKIPILTITPDLSLSTNLGDYFASSWVSDFSVRPVNGEIETGFYVATCETQFAGSEKSMAFEVVGDDNQQAANSSDNQNANPGAAPTPTETQIPPLTGKILFNYNAYQSTRADGSVELGKITGPCIPEIEILQDGAFSGFCEIIGSVAHLTTETIYAEINGTAVRGGDFNYIYTVEDRGSNGWNLQPGQNGGSTNVWSNDAVWTVTYTGTGSFTSATEASGTATFEYSCDSGADNLFWCGDQISQWKEQFSGTIPWSFTANP